MSRVATPQAATKRAAADLSAPCLALLARGVACGGGGGVWVGAGVYRNVVAGIRKRGK